MSGLETQQSSRLLDVEPHLGEEAFADLGVGPDDHRERFKAEKAEGDQRVRELEELEKLLEKLLRNIFLCGRWRKGTIAQRIIAKYFIEKALTRDKKLFKARQQEYDQKWE